MKLQLYYFNECPFCRRVLKVINNLNISKIELCNVHENPKHAEYHFNKTNRNTVPCLYINEVPLFESLDIIDWINQHQSELK